MKIKSLLLACLLFISFDVLALSHEQLRSWVNTNYIQDQANTKSLYHIYDLMMNADYVSAERELELLYQKEQGVLPLWIALLAELERFEKIQTLVEEGIIERQSDNAVLAHLYTSTLKPSVEFQSNNEKLELEDHFLVTVPRLKLRLNGKDYYFILDTGAEINLISQRVAKDLGLELSKSPTSAIDTSTDVKVDARITLLPDFKLGPALVRNQAVVVVDDKDVEQTWLGFNWYQLDGIIGWPVLKKLRLQIDFDDNAIIVAKPENRLNRNPNFVWLFEDPMVISEFDSAHKDLLFLDTGAMDSQVTSWYISKYKIDIDEWQSESFDGLGGKGKAEKFAELGPVRFKFPSSMVNHKKLKARVEHIDCTTSRCEGRIGVDSAEGKQMVIDFPNATFDIQ